MVDEVEEAAPRVMTPPSDPSPDDKWRVLPSGLLAYKLPSKKGKPIWFDAMNGVKVCEHGASGAQIHHWRSSARPRPKPHWVTCDCTDAKGLTTNPKKVPQLPADVPAYHEVLWRQAQPELLQPKGVLAVAVPGKPKGHSVYLDAEGKPLCAHGYTASELRRRRMNERVAAASKLQQWWLMLPSPWRKAVRTELLRHQGAAAATFTAPPTELRLAAVVWRTQSERRREAPSIRRRRRTEKRSAITCRCTTAGLRLERFCIEPREEWPSRKRKQRADATDIDPLVEICINCPATSAHA